MEETRAAWAKYSVIICQIASASAGVCGHPRYVRAGDGLCAIMRKQGNWHKWQKPRWGGRNIASASFRQIPLTSATFADGRRKMGTVNYAGNRATWPKLQRPGRVGRSIGPVSLRQRPRTIANVRDMCGRKAGDGSLKLRRGADSNATKSQKPGRGGRNIASVSIRQHPM